MQNQISIFFIMNTFSSINPFNQALIYTEKSWEKEQIQQFLKQAPATFKNWKNIAIQQRIEFLKSVQFKLQANQEEIAQWITLEMGKTITESQSEIQKCIGLFDYYFEIAETVLITKELPQKNFKKAWVRHEALGCILGIMPWNFPLWQVFRFAIPALLAGNTILLKHAPNVSKCNRLIESLFSEIPHTIYTACFAEVEDIELIIQDSIIGGVSLTGSEKAGSAVASLAGKHIKKTLLELGGNDAFVLLPNTKNWKEAIEKAAFSRLLTAGQTCISTKRLLIPTTQETLVLEYLKELLSKKSYQNPLEKSCSMGVLARKDLQENLQNQLNRLVGLGAEIVFQQGKTDGNYFPPTLVKIDAKINQQFDEELFGPVLLFCTYEDKKEAIELVNDSSFGLGCAIWSSNEAAAISFSEKIEAGSIAINTIVQSNAYLPFGGIKKSGYGRELGEEALLEFVNKKVVYIGS